ncbi:hypothetical protein TNCV_2129031 [Trichonephila clavipes]|nr:hypothetical protein TNCV_2129031 [Trichonephila clavipes]
MGCFWEFPAFWGSHGPREDITPLTPDQSEKLIVFRKRILSRIQKRGNVSPFARVRPQRWGRKDAFHRIPVLVNRANVKTAIITLGTGDLPSVVNRPPL